MATRVLVFSRIGRQLGELEPDISEVSWRLNNVGRAKLAIPYIDPKCTKTNLNYGNRVIISFDNGLPDWGGVIDPPRTQTADGVAVTVHSAERIFSWRVTRKSRYFSNTTPGRIFERLLMDENADWATGIVPDNIDYGGTPRTLDYHLHDLLKRYQDLTRLTGQDFDVTAVYDGSTVAFRANWYMIKGIDKSSRVSLVEGQNILDIKLDEQGDISNTIYLAGQGQTWGSDRYIATATDLDSEADYDRREYAEVQSGVKFPDTLDKNATELLAEKKQPFKRFQLRVANETPGTFGQYDIGDRVKLRAFFAGGDDWAYDGTVRIIARQWNQDNTCRLEVEEYA